MRLSRIVVRNFRSFALLDIPIVSATTCIIGENNTGKSNLLHAIRLCLDVNLASSYRALAPTDVHSAVDISRPEQVVVSVEFTDFAGNLQEEALVGAWQHQPGVARLIYRYRPKLGVREDLLNQPDDHRPLMREDYQWEITGGGDPAIDVTQLTWDQDIGTSIRFADLQSFLVVLLPALRDVESDLRQYRSSPLVRLVDAMDIDAAEQESLVQSLRSANDEIAAAPTIASVAAAVDSSLKGITGPAFSMDVGVGLADPSFQAIARALRLLLSNAAMSNFEPGANGLGLNNVLYLSILVEYFNRRMSRGNTAGQLLLIEEPEAHLHPQLQVTLYQALSDIPVQSVMTTHSAHITASAPLESYVVLTNTGGASTTATVPACSASMDANSVQDLERYLDVTRSGLLYARKVMLVEGPAELFLIPALAKQVLGVDFDREGITVVPIHGVHFEVYARLFSHGGVPKRCAIVADGDLKPSDCDPSVEGEGDLPPPATLEDLETDHVRVFTCATTFERAVANSGNLEMFAAAADDLGATTVAAALRRGIGQVQEATEEARNQILNPLRGRVLSTARRYGKARFAQVATRHVETAESMPKYIAQAIEWLMS